MAVPTVEKGRGAWTIIGKDNGSRYYCYVAGKPLDGSQPTKDVNYEAVHYAVRAIQARVNAFGYNSYGLGSVGSAPIAVDGLFGKTTADAVKWFQSTHGLVADGIVGPTTALALWRDLLVWFGETYHVPASQLYGFMMMESGRDPGAVGYTTPSDRGLLQINLNAHPNITVAQAFDPNFTIDYTAKRLQGARIQFSGKTSDLKNRCAIAQHNSPLQAKQWYTNEFPPSEQIKTYVDKVLGFALTFT
jgi:peptidoglycan hydrolase-like protein with peptidoglycan-binding domain